MLIVSTLAVLCSALLVEAAEKGKSFPQEVMSGKDMKSKLGVLYLMGAAESQGMLDLADSGYLPIVKTGRHSTDRGVRVKQHNPKAIFAVGMHGEFDTKKDASAEAQSTAGEKK